MRQRSALVLLSLLLLALPAQAARKKAGGKRPPPAAATPAPAPAPVVDPVTEGTGTAPGPAPAATRGPPKSSRARTLVVMPFQGPLAVGARAGVAVVLSKRPELSLVPLPQVDAALRLLGAEPQTETDFQSIGKALDAPLLVQGAANKKALFVRVISGDTGAVLAQQTFALKQGNLRPLKVLLWPKLRKALMAPRQVAPPVTNTPPPGEQTPPPVAQTPPPVAQTQTPPPAVKPPPPATKPPPPPPPVAHAEPPPPVHTEPPPPSENASSGPTEVVESAPTKPPPPTEAAILDVAIYGGILRRSLQYTDDIFQALSTYQLNGAPTIGGTIEAYPIMLATPLYWNNIGFTFRGESAVGLRSETQTGSQTFSTTADDVEGGVKLRIPLGRSEVGVGVSYGFQEFTFNSPSAASAPTIPNVSYQWVGGRGNGRIAIGPVAILLGAEYLAVTNTGGMKTYFPRLSVGGVGGTVGVSYAFLGDFDVRLLGTYKHYFYTLNPQPGDANVAGGALDQYITGTVAIGWRYH